MHIGYKEKRFVSGVGSHLHCRTYSPEYIAQMGGACTLNTCKYTSHFNLSICQLANLLVCRLTNRFNWRQIYKIILNYELCRQNTRDYLSKNWARVAYFSGGKRIISRLYFGDCSVIVRCSCIVLISFVKGKYRRKIFWEREIEGGWEG